MGGAGVTLTLNGVKKHHHSKSTPTSPTHQRYCYSDLQPRQSSEPRKRVTLASSHRSSPVSCASSHSDSRNLQGSSREMRITNNSKQRIGRSYEVSPFSRSRSRIFYASDDLWNEVMDSHTKIPTSEEDNRSHFDRNCNRSSSGRKSHDSGFSDSGEVAGQPAMKIQQHQERKPQKWSSTFPIKAFLKSHDFTDGHLPKLSMLRCCIGVEPGSYLHSKHKKVASTENRKIESGSNNALQSEVQESKSPSTQEIQQSSQNDSPTQSSQQNSMEGMGTWPRVRKSKGTNINAPFSVPPKPTYQSTRLRKHHKSREQIVVDGSKSPHEQNSSQSTLNERFVRRSSPL